MRPLAEFVRNECTNWLRHHGKHTIVCCRFGAVVRRPLFDWRTMDTCTPSECVHVQLDGIYYIWRPLTLEAIVNCVGKTATANCQANAISAEIRLSNESMQFRFGRVFHCDLLVCIAPIAHWTHAESF